MFFHFVIGRRFHARSLDAAAAHLAASAVAAV